MKPWRDFPVTWANVFEWSIRVYWEDTDAGGVVFYANYLKFFERVRTEWLRSLGVDQSRMQREHGAIFVVADTQVRYFAPARLDDELRVTARLISKGRASLGIEQHALRGSQLLAQGHIRIGCVEQSSFKPTRVPGFILDKLQI
jgi:acyl-CoA thioester hydrolase